MQQILCFEIIQSKVQLTNRKVILGLEVEQHTTQELWADRMEGGAAWKDESKSLKPLKSSKKIPSYSNTVE